MSAAAGFELVTDLAVRRDRSNIAVSAFERDELAHRVELRVIERTGHIKRAPLRG